MSGARAAARIEHVRPPRTGPGRPGPPASASSRACAIAALEKSTPVDPSPGVGQREGVEPEVALEVHHVEPRHVAEHLELPGPRVAGARQPALRRRRSPRRRGSATRSSQFARLAASRSSMGWASYDSDVDRGRGGTGFARPYARRVRPGGPHSMLGSDPSAVAGAKLEPRRAPTGSGGSPGPTGGCSPPSSRVIVARRAGRPRPAAAVPRRSSTAPSPTSDRGQLTCSSRSSCSPRWPTPALALLERYLSSRIGEGLIYDLRVALFDHVQRCRSPSSPAPRPAPSSAA